MSKLDTRQREKVKFKRRFSNFAYEKANLFGYILEMQTILIFLNSSSISISGVMIENIKDFQRRLLLMKLLKDR